MEGTSNLFKLMITFSIFSIAALFLSTANADTQDTIIVPFDFNGKVCGELENGNYVCEWDPNRINLKDAIENGTDTIPDVLTGSTTTCPDRFDIQEDGVTCLPKECQEGYHFTLDYYCEKDTVPATIIHDRVIAPFERQLEAYENNPPTTWDELDEKWKLEHLMKCWYGLDSSRGIQSEKSFVTSSWDEESDVPKATNISIIDRAIDQCKAQTEMLNILEHGRNDDTVRSPQNWFGTIQTHHSEIAVDVPVWSQERVNIEANKGIDTTKNYCEEVKHLSLQTRAYLNCDPPREYVNIGATISYGSIAEDRMNQYILDGGKAMAEEIRADILADKIGQFRESMIQQSEQQQQQVSITEQIRKIENNGWNFQIESERTPECQSYLDGKNYDKLTYLRTCGQ